MSASLSSRGPARQAAKKASTKFEAQLMSSPARPDGKASPAKPKRAISRPNLKSQAASSSKRSATLSRPGAVIRKRAISLDSRRSDDGESDLTSLSTPSPTLKPKSAPSRPQIGLPETEFSANYVWVLLDFDGQAFGLGDEDDGVERIWWPGLVRSYLIYFYVN